MIGPKGDCSFNSRVSLHTALSVITYHMYACMYVCMNLDTSFSLSYRIINFRDIMFVVQAFYTTKTHNYVDHANHVRIVLDEANYEKLPPVQSLRMAIMSYFLCA